MTVDINSALSVCKSSIEDSKYHYYYANTPSIISASNNG